MTIITVSRLLGSLGDEIAKKVAEHFNYRLVNRDLINLAARQSGASVAALADIDELGLLGFQPSTQECHAYQQAIRRILREIAGKGEAVILGRGGQVVLREWPGSLHVRIIAPLELRIQRVAQKQGIEPAAAQAQIEASDRARLKYLRRCHKVNWNEPGLYDLVLNTRQLNPDQAAEIICFAYQHQSYHDARES